MKLSRFDTLLDAYGSQPEHWPERERAAALALTGSSPRAAQALARARRLDAALLTVAAADSDIDHERLTALRARIVAAARPLVRNSIGHWLGFDLTPSHVWPSLAGLALATLLGFGVGIGGLFQVDAGRDTEYPSVLSTIDFPVASE